MNIHESVHEILLRSDTLANLFYLVFLDKYPEVQTHFQGVDMKRQNLLLTMALLMVERHAEHDYPATEAYFHMLGRQHQWRAIPRKLYPKWREALLGTLERFHGPQWNEDLSRQWASALDAAIKSMLMAYA